MLHDVIDISGSWDILWYNISRWDISRWDIWWCDIRGFETWCDIWYLIMIRHFVSWHFVILYIHAFKTTRCGIVLLLDRSVHTPAHTWSRRHIIVWSWNRHVYLYNIPGLFDRNDIGDILRGAVLSSTLAVGAYYTAAVSNLSLFYKLPVDAVQRGRDHGLPSYNDAREVGAACVRACVFAWWRDCVCVRAESFFFARLKGLCCIGVGVCLWVAVVSGGGGFGLVVVVCGGGVVVLVWELLFLLLVLLLSVVLPSSSLVLLSFGYMFPTCPTKLSISCRSIQAKRGGSFYFALGLSNSIRKLNLRRGHQLHRAWLSMLYVCIASSPPLYRFFSSSSDTCMFALHPSPPKKKVVDSHPHLNQTPNDHRGSARGHKLSLTLMRFSPRKYDSRTLIHPF